VSLHLLIPAAGTGQRLGRSLPKALVTIDGRPMISLALLPFAGIPFERCLVVSPAGFEREIERAIHSRGEVVAGGATRAESVALGFRRLEAGPRDFIVIHDAARPFVRPEEIQDVIEGAEETGAAAAVMPVPDTLKRTDGEWILETVDRQEVAAAATPQVFRADVLGRALAQTGPATDEAARCEAIGVRVAAVYVSRLAFKITYPEDLEMAEALLRSQK
jgi:2-C-methyl-D-erythritol 4-phosphate cytidylyltransferase